MIRICFLAKNTYSRLGIKKEYTKKIFNIEFTKLSINPQRFTGTIGRRYDIMFCDVGFKRNQKDFDMILEVFKPMCKKFIMWGM